MKEKMSGFLFSLTVNSSTAASITINLFLVKEEIKKDCKNKKRILSGTDAENSIEQSGRI